MEEVKELLITSKEFLANLIDDTKDICELLQGAEETQALKLMPELFDGIFLIIKAMSQLESNDVTIMINESISDRLHELEEAMIIRDNVLICDILEYEIVPILQQWYEALKNRLSEGL
ncbi:hypothetical protein ACF5W4_16715 [Bacillota bacterium Lsc_1132]